MKRVFLITGISALVFLLSVEYVERYYISWIICFMAAVGLLSAAIRLILGLRKALKNTSYPKSKSFFEILITVCVSVCLCGTVYSYNIDRYNSVVEQYGGQTLDCTFQVFFKCVL